MNKNKFSKKSYETMNLNDRITWPGDDITHSYLRFDAISFFIMNSKCQKEACIHHQILKSNSTHIYEQLWRENHAENKNFNKYDVRK